MPEARPPFTRDDLVSAFSDLGARAAAAGKVIDLLVYGGSCLMLVSNFRLSSADVDAVALDDQPYVDRLAREVAQARGWPDDWLNDGVRTYLSPNVEPTEHHILFGSYPNEHMPGLRVFVPTPEYMLAMKLMALRVDPGSDGGKDLADIVNLMHVLRMRRKSDLLSCAAQYYSEARLNGKLALALDSLWSHYEKSIANRNDVPPKYLGRDSREPES